MESHNDREIIDWNNFNGHIVVGRFVYAKEEYKFFVIFHKDLNIFLYPGGHVNNNEDPLQVAKKKIIEETSLNNLKQLKLSGNELILINIDTHLIKYNQRLNLQKHYHFDFRYLYN